MGKRDSEENQMAMTTPERARLDMNSKQLDQAVKRALPPDYEVRLHDCWKDADTLLAAVSNLGKQGWTFFVRWGAPNAYYKCIHEDGREFDSEGGLREALALCIAACVEKEDGG